MLFLKLNFSLFRSSSVVLSTGLRFLQEYILNVTTVHVWIYLLSDVNLKGKLQYVYFF